MSQLLQNVPTSTSFQFGALVYKQRGGVAMGDPLCAFMCSFFIEDLQKKAITSAGQAHGRATSRTSNEDTRQIEDHLILDQVRSPTKKKRMDPFLSWT